eukprot:TRINITY_DN11876_c0_g1_i1.p1 TRINITY_DN11876_c0_g1~~TRINITY_DN11876_c0_g1_i1.p1  ORF type:complete len:334 (+),score=45.32 TRINITY_DN11876_c0_g1_i1:58-1059(+)
MDVSDFPLPLDIFRYSIVPKTRRRELCFLRSTCRILRTSILLPQVVLTLHRLSTTPKDEIKHALQLSESVDAIEFNPTALLELAPLLENNTTVKEIRTDRTLDVKYQYLFENVMTPEAKRTLGAQVGDSFAKIFKSPNKIALLDLSNSALGPQGVTSLVESLIEAKNPSLKTLNLSQTDLELDGCRAIARLIEQARSLTSIDISSNKMSVECAEALATALTRTTSLTHLDVGCCFEKSPATIAILSSLKANHSIQSLSLEHVFFGSDVGKAISELLAVNTTLKSLNGSNTSHYNVNVTVALSHMLRQEYFAEDSQLVSDRFGVGWMQSHCAAD